MAKQFQSLGSKVLAISKILNETDRTNLTISIKGSDECFERVKISARRIDVFWHQIESIKEKTGLKLFTIHYWNEPDFCVKHPNVPKYMKRYTDGQHIEIMFTKDLRQ